MCRPGSEDLVYITNLMIVHNMEVEILTSLCRFMEFFANFAESFVIRVVITNTVNLGDRRWDFKPLSILKVFSQKSQWCPEPLASSAWFPAAAAYSTVSFGFLGFSLSTASSAILDVERCDALASSSAA